MTEELQRKVDRAIKLIQSAGKIAKEHGQPLEVSYSGGKDSDVILELARMSGADIRPIYKNTTIDPPGTIAHVQKMGVEIMRPKETFAQLMARKGFPSRVARFCCADLKEYKVLDYNVIGVRREESKKRAERYKEPEQCRVYPNKERERLYLPILDWTKQDIADFIKDRGIQCHALYYDDQGNFHAERRLGCMCCPLASRRKRIMEFKEHPNMVKMYCRQGIIYRRNHPDSKNNQLFPNVYEWLTFTLFADNMNDFHTKFGANLFDNGMDCKVFLEEYFGIDL